MRRRLPTIEKKTEGLGRPTIMDRALAQQHGAPYVHLAVFAIDVDRVRDALEEEDVPQPFGWEVFLTEAYMLGLLDPKDPAARSIVEDVVLGVIERTLEEESTDVLFGSQLPFAVWDAIARGAWPEELRSAFSEWKARPKELVKGLAPLWKDGDAQRRALAQLCLDTEMEPPLAPPTLDALRELATR